MKSQVSALLKKLQTHPTPSLLKEGHYLLSEQLICEIAYEFQEAVVEVLVKKLIRA